MLKDITLGQYYQTDSVIHRLDPRVKLIGTFAYIVSLFIVNNITGYILAAVTVSICITLSHIPFHYIVRGIKPIVVIMIVTFIFNLFLTPGNTIWSFWIFSITWEGLVSAVKMAVRLLLLIIGSTLMTLTTTPNQLTDAMENVMRPLRLFHVPVSEIAMMMSIALRFIPILTEETDKIEKAQMARGANFESKHLVEKVKAMVPLLVPLFLSAFRRAADLAQAMEARCYRGGDGRTKMKPLVYKRTDLLAYMVLTVYFAACICVRIWAGGLDDLLFDFMLRIYHAL